MTSFVTSVASSVASVAFVASVAAAASVARSWLAVRVNQGPIQELLVLSFSLFFEPRNWNFGMSGALLGVNIVSS